MSYTIDLEALTSRAGQSLRRVMQSLDVWVEADDLSRTERHSAVSSALDAVGTLGLTRFTRAYPTERGSLAWLAGLRDPAETLDHLGRALDGTADTNWHLTVPDMPVHDDWYAARPEAGVTMAFSLDRPRAMAPLNELGNPDLQWGFPDDLSPSVLAGTVDWVFSHGQRETFDAGIEVPVFAQDAVDLLTGHLQGRPQQVSVRSHDSTGTVPIRTATLDYWGTIRYAERPGAESPVRTLLPLTDLLRSNADALDLAFGEYDMPAPLLWEVAPFPWVWYRDLWAEYLPDAFPIMLLTEAHLARTHDLSSWHVERVGDRGDRYLLTSPHLEDWVNEPELSRRFPPGPLLLDAQAALGDAIMTQAQAAELDAAARRPPTARP